MNILNTILEWIALILVVLGIVLLFTAKSLRPLLLAGVQTIWRRKYLWFVGIFAGLAAYGGEVNFLARKIYDIASFRDLITAIRDIVVKGQTNDLLTLLKNGFHSAPWLMIAYIALALLIVAIFYWLIIISQGIIMRLTGRIASGQPASFIDAVAAASGKFWDLVKLIIIFLLIGWGFWLVAVGIPTMIFFLSNSNGWANVAEIGSYFSLVVSFVNLFLIQYAAATILLMNKTTVESIVHAWNLFRRNALITLELALTLFAANLLVLFVVASILTFIFPTPTPAGFYITIAALLLELGVLSSFSYAVTVDLFVKLQNASPESKIGEWTERIVNLATAKKPA